MLYCLTAIGVGVVVDCLDYLLYEPAGAIGFGRQRGPAGCLGALLWAGGATAFAVMAVAKLVSL